MKAITLWQPWASLLACGAKKYETRSWATSYRGEIAIHAALKDPCKMPLLGLADFEEAVKEEIERKLIEPWCFMPRGCVIATAELVGCHKVTHASYPDGGGQRRLTVNANGGWRALMDKELIFGDFSVGRYAWEFANMKMLDEPIPAKGKQGLWNWGDK